MREEFPEHDRLEGKVRAVRFGEGPPLEDQPFTVVERIRDEPLWTPGEREDRPGKEEAECCGEAVTSGRVGVGGDVRMTRGPGGQESRTAERERNCTEGDERQHEVRCFRDLPKRIKTSV